MVTGRGIPVVLRHRDFALLWSGQSASLLGDGIFTVALALEALRVDHNPIGLSLVLAARLVPAVALLLLGGVVVDRVPRRLAMLASDAARAVVVGLLALAIAAQVLRLWQLMAMSAVFGIGDAVFGPASTAIIPELLPTSELTQGSALSVASQQLARMVGPALGGLVVAFAGYAWAFGINAASFVVSAACLAAMSRRPGRGHDGRSLLAQAREGLRYCWSQRWLWVAILAAGVGNFAAFSPLAVLVPLLVRHDLRQGPLALGMVVAAGGAGGAIASLIVGKTGPPRRRISAMFLSWAGAGIAVAGLGLVPSTWAAAVLQALVWALVMGGNVLWYPLMQERVPAELQGRAFSVDMIASFVLSPMGVLLAGAAAGSVGTREVLVAGGCLAALSGLLLFVPGVRDPERGVRRSLVEAPESR